jgi:hypothetical protein
MADESSSTPLPDALAADRLALALEGAGFDVGVDFPSLRSGWDESGAPGVQVGAVTYAVAAELAMFLEDAVNAGVTLLPR